MRRTWELSNIVVNIQSDDEIHQVSQMAKSHPPGQLRWFLPSKFPQGKVGEGILPWSSQAGCHRGRERQEPEKGPSLLEGEKVPESASKEQSSRSESSRRINGRGQHLS